MDDGRARVLALRVSAARFLPRNHSDPALTPRAHRSFRKLIEDRSVDILQPDVMWLGGLTERECPGPVLAGCELFN